MGFFSNLSQSHNDLKRRIHAFRIPLGPRGQVIMGCVYFSIPFVIGYPIYKWSRRCADENIGINGENLHVTRAARKSVQRNRDQLQELLQNAQNSTLGKGSNWAKEMDAPRHR